MNLKITKDDDYYFIELNGKRLDGCFDNRDLIRAVIGLIRSSFNITDNKLEETYEKYY